ncbi:MAG: protein kinase [Candidatus Sericytochromatia bacterium]|nr:protein kinase [Candidatus Sericytochromatia bacterium]
MEDLPRPFTARYRLLNALGEGAMGMVYRASDLLRERKECALKVLKPAGDGADAARRRFRAEFHAMAWLNHPNTVHVYEYGELPDGTVFIVMEMVPGQSLSDVIGDRPVPLATFYPLLIQLLQALDYIHARRYLHRDIKAENIRVRPDGLLKLMDFGLMGRIGQVPLEGLCGTLHYMAPELLRDGGWTPATDLYAVGCLAYEMLTGRLPFLGEASAVARGHLEAEPTSLRTLRPDAAVGLIKLVERLLAKDPARRPHTAGDALNDLAAITGIALTRETRDQQLSFLETSGLVGREAELEQLDGVLRQALHGTGTTVMLGAPSGLGKSRLLQELEVRAQLQGFVVLRGRCLGEEQAPWEPIRTALRGALAHGSQEVRDRHQPAIRALYPELAGSGVTVLTPVQTDDLVAWLEELSGTHPLLLVLDDIQLADPQTLGMFNAAARRLRGLNVLCVATFPDDETPAGSPVWQLLEEGVATPMRLTPLDRNGQAALVAAMLPGTRVPEAFTDALYRATGGNPLFTKEALKSLVEDGHLTRQGGAWRFPADLVVLGDLERVEETIRRRLGHLGPEALQLLQAAAVLGHQWTLPTLAFVAEADEDQLFAGLVDLTARQLLALDMAGHYGFLHDRVREVAYADIPPALRKEMHMRAAERLELEHATTPMLAAGELARHHLRSDEPANAYPWLLLAGEQAEQAGTTYVALEHLRDAESALADLRGDRTAERLALWLRIGTLAVDLSPGVAAEMLDRAAGALEAEPGRALPLLRKQGLEEQDLLALHARALGTLGESREALRLAERMASPQPEGLQADRPLVDLARFGPLLVSGRIPELVETARRTARLVGGRLPPYSSPMLATAWREALLMQNAVAFQGERPSPVLREQALALAQEAGDEDALAPWTSLGLWAAWSGHPEEAEAVIERTMRKTRRIGAPPSVWVLYLRPYMRWQQGELRPALEQLERSLIAHPQWREHAVPFSLGLALRGQLLADLGRIGEAQQALVEMVEQARSRDHGLAIMHGLCTLGHALIGGGRLTEAGFVFLTAREMATGETYRNPMIEALTALGLGRCACVLGDPRGVALLDEALTIACRPELDNRFVQAHAQRERGKALAALGEQPRAMLAYTEAGRLFHGMRNGHWLHIVNVELAALRQAPAAGSAAGDTTLEARYERFKRLI